MKESYPRSHRRFSQDQGSSPDRRPAAAISPLAAATRRAPHRCRRSPLQMYLARGGHLAPPAGSGREEASFARNRSLLSVQHARDLRDRRLFEVSARNHAIALFVEHVEAGRHERELQGELVAGERSLERRVRRFGPIRKARGFGRRCVDQARRRQRPHVIDDAVHGRIGPRHQREARLAECVSLLFEAAQTLQSKLHAARRGSRLRQQLEHTYIRMHEAFLKTEHSCIVEPMNRARASVATVLRKLATLANPLRTLANQLDRPDIPAKSKKPGEGSRVASVPDVVDETAPIKEPDILEAVKFSGFPLEMRLYDLLAEEGLDPQLGWRSMVGARSVEKLT